MSDNGEKKSVLVIGGTDPVAGAGIYLDNRILQCLSVHGIFIVSAITAQNSQGVQKIESVNSALFEAQLKSIFSEFRPGAIKLGLITESDHFNIIKDYIEFVDCPLIWDPVMASSSATRFVDPETILEGIEILSSRLTLFTPNVPEASQLTGLKIENWIGIEKAAGDLHDKGIKNVYIKGGHINVSADECCDYFYNNVDNFWVSGEKYLENKSVRGTGCGFATSVAAHIAQQNDIRDAVVLARRQVSVNIRNSYTLGKMNFQSCDELPGTKSEHPSVRYRNPEAPKFRIARCDTKRLGIYPVVDSARWVEDLLSIGIKTIQLRIKDGTADIIEQEIRQAIESSRKYNARLFINDYWQLAAKHGAYGVHLGQEDIQSADLQKIADSDLRLGISTHSYWEILATINIDPSYIALGPIYPTTSKPMAFDPQGLEKVNYWIDFLKGEWPLVAIGGINHERAAELKKTGIGSVAMISAITQSENFVSETQALISLWDS